MGSALVYILIGSIAGLIMGLVGVGGGAIIIFSLLFAAHFPQKLAQGTTLFIVAAPVSLLAAYNYYKSGFVDLKAGILIMVFFLLFSYIGSSWGTMLPRETLKTLLGIMLFFMGLKLVFF
ncbi:MAG TPA: sulfite exporter TauE/SafE family protein [Caldithrix sp.]|nr:sulfite exporter TauE/SafE family protein [Caldithrix sp.]